MFSASCIYFGCVRLRVWAMFTGVFLDFGCCIFSAMCIFIVDTVGRRVYKGDMINKEQTMEHVEKTLNELAELFGCDKSDFSGDKLGELLKDAERYGATVFWGCFSDEKLGMIID